MKRKSQDDDSTTVDSSRVGKKRATKDSSSRSSFREGLYDPAASDDFKRLYANSTPYKHGVIPNLISPALLRNVRSEIQENLSFTPKETDIYKIHQSGDLANLDGLDGSSLKLLPSLLTLRDALYSTIFREYLSTITGSGPLSGRKTDMAINVYVPGCHLLCHDDVIGSRRVSYILYLTDPDKPWEAEWGGALRLYPTQTHTGEDGEILKVPSPDHSMSIPPAFNQLSFFAVQPGESFHDVEEVYAKGDGDKGASDDERVRTAISGWYHIPQEGEEGYIEGLEESLAEKSSLMQLQGKGDKFDLPMSKALSYPAYDDSAQKNLVLSEEDLDFLLKYIAPTYLTPDTLESISDIFDVDFSLCLDTFLSLKFSESLLEYVSSQESKPLPSKTAEIDSKPLWTVARPPHKHRFLFQQTHSPLTSSPETESPLQDLLSNLFPSHQFRKWLQIATGQTLSSYDVLARRFRRGKDYTLATGYDEDSPQLEIVLAITPTPGWGGDDNTDGQEDKPQTKEDKPQTKEIKSQTKKISPPTEEVKLPSEEAKPSSEQTNPSAEEVNPLTEEAIPPTEEAKPPSEEAKPPSEVAKENDNGPGLGGYIAYMAADDSGSDSDGGSDDGIKVPASLAKPQISSSSIPSPRKRASKSDPAVYKATRGDDEDDGVLFSMPAGWNRLGIVLRDKGAMKFVKYVSASAKGDRWDLVGEFGVVVEEEEEEETEEVEGDRDGGSIGRGNGNRGTEGTKVGIVESDGDESEEAEEQSEDTDSSD